MIAAVAACSGPERTPPENHAPGRGVYVPLEWRTARTVRGHEAHVVERRIACSRCHELTSDSMGAVTPRKCAACHAKEAAFEHGEKEARAKFGSGVSTDCTSCHAFTLEGSGHPAATALAGIPAPTACARCHAAKESDAPQVEVHATSACVTCHRPHENGKPHGGPCLDCHRDVKTGHATAGKTVSEVCTTCHSHQHARASDAVGTCRSCHASEQPIVPETALFPGGHTQCVGCHKPHDFTRKAAAPCESCHENLHVLGASRVPAHERCESCHSPHDVKNAAEACVGCHESVHPDHPKQAGSCIGCHAPHPAGAAAKGIARPCSTCHQLAASDHDFHGGLACPACHVPHDFQLALSNLSLCEGCHPREVAGASTNPGHRACQQCHRGLPHRPTKLEAGCETCHAPVAEMATKGHAQCTQCHEPHGGAFATECKNCHAAEQRTAPAGHQTCTNCHEQHTGKQKAPCAACHAAESESPHGKIAGGCTNCHEPHGPVGVASPPACATCHDASKLPGLHTVAKHQDCKNCHSGHDDPGRAERAPCLGCHMDRKDHFSTASSCTSCHLFGPTH